MFMYIIISNMISYHFLKCLHEILHSIKALRGEAVITSS